MISVLVLILIYISFISLGLPDSLLGTSWPVMYADLGVDLSILGAISFTTSMGTIMASLSFTKVCRFIKTGWLNAACTLLTGVCLLLISRVESIWMMFPVALFLGLGAGAVDSSLNNYVAIHYKARHMSFLHAFWGVGTIFGPTLLSAYFATGRSWRNVYGTVSMVQLSIAILLILTLSLWKRMESEKSLGNAEEKPHTHSIRQVASIKGVKVSVFSTLLYCGTESMTFIWTASCMTVSRGMSESDAALIVSLLYWGITIGRVATGLVSEKLGDDRLVITGLTITLIAGIFFLAGSAVWLIAVSAFLIGFGFGPVFPSILHQTPEHFGIEDSSAVMGLLMTGAYIGTASMPLLFGLGTKLLTPSYLPWMILLFTGLEVLAWKMRKDTFN